MYNVPCQAGVQLMLLSELHPNILTWVVASTLSNNTVLGSQTMQIYIHLLLAIMRFLALKEHRSTYIISQQSQASSWLSNNGDLPTSVFPLVKKVRDVPSTLVYLQGEISCLIWGPSLKNNQEPRHLVLTENGKARSGSEERDTRLQSKRQNWRQPSLAC